MSGNPMIDKLAAWLGEQEGQPVTIDGLAISTAGARRVNALFSATFGGETRRLALTMIPSASIQLLEVAGEAGVRTLAEQGGVPTPHIHYVCSDASVLGGTFFISTAVDGETVPRRVLRLVEAKGIGELVTTQLGDAMAKLHAVDASKAPASVPRPASTGPIGQAMEIVERVYAGLLTPSPTFSYAVRWLERNAPSEPAAQTIVHTDIRNGNIIVGEDGLRAILDWEGTRIGDPIEDVAWVCTRMWRFREDARTVGGFAGVPFLRDAYIAGGGTWDEDRFRWWRVMGTARWGMSLSGQARGHLDGSYRSIVMAASGRRVPELEYDTLLLLRP
jgi:aminoglycoside phosphotransferase (APT) family kinase protein